MLVPTSVVFCLAIVVAPRYINRLDLKLSTMIVGIVFFVSLFVRVSLFRVFVCLSLPLFRPYRTQLMLHICSWSIFLALLSFALDATGAHNLPINSFLLLCPRRPVKESERRHVSCGPPPEIWHTLHSPGILLMITPGTCLDLLRDAICSRVCMYIYSHASSFSEAVVPSYQFHSLASHRKKKEQYWALCCGTHFFRCGSAGEKRRRQRKHVCRRSQCFPRVRPVHPSI